MSDRIHIVAGDTLPAISGVLSEDDDTPIDITGFDIKLQIGYPEPLVKTASIPIGTDGYFTFPWADEDLEPGIWSIAVQINSPSGRHTLQDVISPYTGERTKLKINISSKVA